MNINGFNVTSEEYLEVAKKFQNTYFPIYDENGKLIDLTKTPPHELVIEAIQELRLKQAK